MKILFLGDITGKTGRHAVAEWLPLLRKKHTPDVVIANVENAAHGKGVTPRIMDQLVDAGVDLFTGGNHIFDKPSIGEVFRSFAGKMVRPANFSDDLPGSGWCVTKVREKSIVLINLNGQVFMENQFDGEIQNPFHELDKILEHDEVKSMPVRVLDFHAEATSEKRAMGFYADGRVSLVLGTHTHVATRDSQVLPKGTGYQTDVGMVGPAGTVIGVKNQGVLARFLAGEKENKKAARLEIEENDMYEIGYCVAEIDEETGTCQNIEGYILYEHASHAN